MENTKNTSISLSMILFIIFLVLKLTNNINWSWWWVTSPLWIGFAVGIAVLLIAGLITVIFKLLS